MLLLGIPFLPIQTEILISPDFHRGFFFSPLSSGATAPQRKSGFIVNLSR